MRNADVWRSLLAHLRESLPEGTLLDLPGQRFSPERANAWVAPRLVGVTRSGAPRSAARGVSGYRARYRLRVTCAVKTQPKGPGAGELEELLDNVRAVVDDSWTESERLGVAHQGVPGVVVRDEGGRDVGVLAFGAADETREHGVTVDVGGQPVPGCDVCVLETTLAGSSARAGEDPTPRVP